MTAALDYIVPDPPPGLDEIVSAVLWSLRPDGPAPAAAVVVEPSRWPACGDAIHEHRIAPSVHHAALSGRLDLPADAVKALAAVTARTTAARMRILASAERATALLSEAGVESRILKGIATGVLDHVSPVVRQTGDVDLLVRRSDFDRATLLLRREGWSESKSGEPTELLVERTFRDHDGIEIDLHHRLFRFGPRDVAELFDAPVTFHEGRLDALPREGRLLHAAAHLLLAPAGRRQLSSLLDVAVIADHPELDRARLAELATRFGVPDLVVFSEWLATELRETGSPEPARRGSLVNRAFIRPNRRIDIETLAVLADLDGARERLRYIRYQLTRSRIGGA